MKNLYRFQFPKFRRDGKSSQILAGMNPKLAHFTRVGMLRTAKPCLSLEQMANGQSGYADGHSGRSIEIKAADEFFITMIYLILATHGSFFAVWLAFQLSFASVVLALLASWFWVKAIHHGKHAVRLFEAADP